MAKLPKMARIRQSFPRPLVADVEATIIAELDKLNLSAKIKPGQKIGITAGSRGIQNITKMLKVVIGYIRNLGAEPQLLAAMGSHGGGTAEGQKEILDSLTITEENMGVKVITCAESVEIGRTNENIPAYVVKTALEMDGIFVVNRVKIHTSFTGKIESGMVKKLVVGLGGPAGAKQFHTFGSTECSRLLQEIGTVILENLPILGGMAIIENAYEETALLAGVERENFIEKEAELLEYSRSLMPSLPLDDIDFLIIQEMGKNYSGTGVDTNIIGRMKIQGVADPKKPEIKRIAILDLSEASHGNANGLGLADFVSQRLVDKMDRQATYFNCLTATFVMRAAIPIYFDRDEKIIDAAINSLGGISERQKVIIIPNTLFLTEMLVSEAALAELKGKPGIEVVTEPEDLVMDASGNINVHFH